MTLREIQERFGELFANAWVLLSDTDRFLSRARLMPRYERRVREWRQRLQESRGDPEAIREVRQEIVGFRKALRSEGWELRLGSLDVVVRGFRSDDSLARGFRRMVIYLAENGSIYHVTGDANHIELDEDLRTQLRARSIGGAMQPHYLWYRVSAGRIELAGADSEDRESLDRFSEVVDERKSDLVKALRDLH